MKKYTPEYALELLHRQSESRKRYAETRKKTHRKLGLEVSPLAAHALHVLAESEGVSMSVALTRILEGLAQRRGIDPPPDVSQLVTPKESAPAKGHNPNALAGALANWDDDECHNL